LLAERRLLNWTIRTERSRPEGRTWVGELQMNTRHTHTSPVRLRRAAGFGRKPALMLSAAAVALMSLPAGQALAQTITPDTLPTNPAVVGGGSATFGGGGLVLDVNQSSDRVVIDWDSFSIGQDATVNFYQPGADSVAINRVNAGGDLSEIYG